jgi:hypothetical protein
MATEIKKKKNLKKSISSLKLDFSLPFSSRKRKQAFKATMLSVYIYISQFEILSQITEIRAIRWAYAIGVISNPVLSNFL